MYLQSRIRRRFLRPTVLALMLGGFISPGLAADLVIDPFPRAEVSRQQVQQDVEHMVVIGNIRRINNKLRAEREVLADGELARTSWRIPDGHSAREAMAHAANQLREHPHTTLFFCEGRECGSSSLWANQVLGYSRLYGPEENQLYLSLRLDDKPQRFVSLYAITRGNGEVFLHMDQMTPTEPVTDVLYPTPATLSKMLHADGELQLPGVTPEVADSAVTKAWLDLLARMMRSDARMRIQVDGAQAPAFIQGLLDRNIDRQRLEVGEPEPQHGVRLERR